MDGQIYMHAYLEERDYFFVGSYVYVCIDPGLHARFLIHAYA